LRWRELDSNLRFRNASHRRERPRPRSRRLIQRERRLLEWPPSDPIGWSDRNCSAEPPRIGSIGFNSDEASKPLNIGRGTEGSHPAPSSSESATKLASCI